MGKAVFFVTFAMVMRACTPTALTVETAQGVLEGVPRDGYTSYIGIPYGNVTDKNAKFMSGGLAPSWSGVRRGAPCFDSHCLQLDIHVPNGHGTRAVLVWLSGGAPARLVRKGIIVVQVHYRTGPFGFLCLGTEKIPGNTGVRDVVQALRWVQNNIVAFHGLPEKLVVGGQGFGAAVVEALLLSPSTAGLFDGAIMQSGSLLSPWAFNYDAEERAIELSRHFTNDQDPEGMTDALINAKEADLIEKTKQLEEPYFPFGICDENPVKEQESLLPEAPIYLLTNNKINDVPLMIGYNSDEGYIFGSNLMRAQVLSKMNSDLSFLLPEGLVFYDDYEMAQVAKQINDMYFRGKTMEAVLEYHRDAYYLNHVYRSARLHAQGQAAVYLYQFSHASDAGVLIPELDKTGAAHSDEMAYLFPDEGRVYEGEDLQVQDTLLQLWSNFVKYLHPNLTNEVQWERLSPESPRLLDIGSKGASMVDFPHARAARFWDNIYDQYYYKRQDSKF